jgi:transcriptional regulator with XRE-family HTH domain
MCDMATSGRRLAVAIADARAIRRAIGDEIRQARLNTGLSQLAAGLAVGMSHAQLGRIERAELRGLTVDQVVRACTSVGLRASIRAFPSGDPLRDAAHLALIDRLRRELPPAASMRTEVPVVPAGDLRAWDAIVRIGHETMAIEAETRLRDLQALERRLALKMRDGRIGVLILLVSATRGNRRTLSVHREALRGLAPLDTREVLGALRAGHAPKASGLVIL